MFPNTFLKTFWGMELKPIVFVAMSFDPKYNSRHEEVIEPAVAAIPFDGGQLAAYRVDLSKTGDSILTDIMDGIAHCQLFLAEVSTVGKDAEEPSKPYRNGNVLYEVGVALACRQPSEVLLIRDDDARFLFDVSTIPHEKIDFSHVDGARTRLTELLSDRLAEQQFKDNARLRMALDSLTSPELRLLKEKAGIKLGNKFYVHEDTNMAALGRLMDNQIIRYVGIAKGGIPILKWTQFGHKVAQIISRQWE